MRNGTEKSQSEENVHDLIKGKLDINHIKKNKQKRDIELTEEGEKINAMILV